MSNVMKSDEKKLINQLFWRSFALEGSFNYEKMQALGFAWAMFPAIKLYCKTPQEQVEALKRHTAFFNITPNICTFSLGMAASMEKEYAEKKDMDPSTINAVKVSLMGPLSGIGISLAQQGSILGPILFLLLFNVPHLIIRYYCTIWGYQLGSKFIQTSYENGLIQHMTKLATVIGLTTVGAMIATMVTFNVGFTAQIGETTLVLQEVFDQIVPKILPLLLTLGAFGAIRKGVKVNTVILAIFAFGLIGTLIGLL